MAGTLTRNIMEFRKCSIGGRAYGFGTTEIGRAAAMRAGAVSSALTPGAPAEGGGDPRSAQVLYNPKLSFDDTRMVSDLRRGGEQSAAVDAFLTLLAVCHTVIPERSDETGELLYRAASPDEEALVLFAKAMGYEVRAPGPRTTVRVCAFGESKEGGGGDGDGDRVYRVVGVNQFNSTRKRMSVVVECPDGVVRVMVKGADSTVLPLCGGGQDEEIAKLTRHLEVFAGEGLRTLVCGWRELSADEARAWEGAFQQASSALEEREAKLEAVASSVECGLTLVGATAIEDKLQEGVPSCIADLASGGVKIWVLTGDKVETAINIGFACRLLTSEMRLIRLVCGSAEELKRTVDRVLCSKEVRPLVEGGRTSDNLALVVDGGTLVHVFSEAGDEGDGGCTRAWVWVAVCELTCGAFPDSLPLKFLALARCCKAVVACRVSPSQKAAVVALVRERISPEPMTLAIGDGANDVNMIQARVCRQGGPRRCWAC